MFPEFAQNMWGASRLFSPLAKALAERLRQRQVGIADATYLS
jgi:hypothetical protein